MDEGGAEDVGEDSRAAAVRKCLVTARKRRKCDTVPGAAS